MPAPAAPFIPPEDLPRLALDVIRRARFPMLATLSVSADGLKPQPRVRPVSPVRTEDFTVYIANLRRYGKTREIEQCPQVELCYLDDQHDQVRITAVAEVEARPEVLDEIWQSSPLLRKYLGQPDNPDLIIYRLRPERIRLMKEWALEYFEVPVPPMA